ncbi:hypothetical protein JOQ06_026277 [Pogonophryne albipinna]|uniref:Uncharacterized protein n=1 Tax=Pogonophryne albipinna TaxID=1090488 RepID=A0AAD6A881_9TELE|nr:hypothetical protein JOQ06_026277 [Pogonophryne albipinna]
MTDKLTLLSLLLSTAGRCLANQMFTLWRREEEEHREQPRLTERSWVLLSCSLAALLSLSLLLHLLRACRGAACQREPEGLDYSYVPLTHINGDAGKSGFQLDDSDSQDEIWSPSRSGRTTMMQFKVDLGVWILREPEVLQLDLRCSR